MAITTFIPKLWAARLHQAYEADLVFGKLLNRNYEGEIKQKGDTVHINTLNDVTIKEYESNTEIAAPEQLTTVEQLLTIDHAAYYNFYIDDVDKVQASGDLMNTAMTNAAHRLAEDAEEYIIGKVLEGAATTVTKQDDLYATIVAMKTALDKKKVPQAGRYLVVSPTAEGALLLDDRFVKSGVEAGETRLQNGRVARAAGFDIYVSLSAQMENKLVAGVTDAATFANQLAETVAYRPEKGFSDAVKGLSVCGAKVTRPDAICVCNMA
jgi:hypothetical protein